MSNKNNDQKNQPQAASIEPPKINKRLSASRRFDLLVRFYHLLQQRWEALLPLLFLYIVLLPTPAAASTVSTDGTVATIQTADNIVTELGDFGGTDTYRDGRRLRSAVRHPKRRRSKRSQELEKEREARKQRTIAEIDALHAVYWAEAGHHRSWATGVAYARFSTRFQESIADQIRDILEFALKNQIRIPRHLIFFDLAVRGVKQRRDGLDQVKAVLRARKATVLVLFSTNRLFRKTYMTLQFVETMYRELQARCIFVKTGIDTDNRDQWESMLHMHAMMDQFVVRVGIAHIHAAHVGMLTKRIVFGTLSFGYGGKTIPGEFTKRGKPRREIIVDEATAAIVVKIFRWYVEDRLDIIEIIRLLNADSSIPLPPRAFSGEWTRLAVRTILKNTRYRGLWRYGFSEAVFLPEADYVRQRPRVEALKEIPIEDFRIVSDKLWYGAQERLASERGKGGRPPVDGDHVARPKLINGLVVCPKHEDQILYPSGPYANHMQCPQCRLLPAEERPLYTVLKRALATKLILNSIVDAMNADDGLVERSIIACQEAAEEIQRPNPDEAPLLRQEIAQFERAIKLTRRTAGDSKEEQDEAEKEIRDLQGEACGKRARLADLESLSERVIRIPTADELHQLRRETAKRLLDAVGADDREVIVEARRILELVTGGRIALEQMGERKQKRGWLRASFRLQLVHFLTSDCGGDGTADDGVEITVDIRDTSKFDADVETVWQLVQQKVPRAEIARQIGRNKNYVCKLLKHACKLRGVPYPDGRANNRRRPPRPK